MVSILQLNRQNAELNSTCIKILCDWLDKTTTEYLETVHLLE